MPNIFEQHLEASFKDRPLLAESIGIPTNNTVSEDVDDDADVETIIEVIDGFAAVVNDDYDLEAQFDAYLEENYESFTEDDVFILKGVLLEMANNEVGGNTDDDVRSLLKTLAEPFPTSTQKGWAETGMNHLSKDFLEKFAPVSAVADPYGNRSFSSSKYQYFPRGKNRYGHESEFEGDPKQAFNDMRPAGQVLANPALNVAVQKRAYESIDAVGLGNIMHYRVLDRLRGVYVTAQIHREQADEIAASLNHEYEQVLAENPQLVEDFNRAMSEQQMRVHSTLGSVIAPAVLEENLNRPLDPRYFAAFPKKEVVQPTNSEVKSDALLTDHRREQGPINDTKSGLLLVEQGRNDKGGEVGGHGMHYQTAKTKAEPKRRWDNDSYADFVDALRGVR